MFDRATWYLFLLAAALIGAVYYVGVKTDVQAFSAAFNSGFATITGRDNQGQFQGVPAAGAPFTS